MYGGLFGDLPSAKNVEQKSDEETNEKQVLAPPSTNDASLSTAAIPSSTALKKKPGVLTGLGNAGTSMAFVPTALRPRKRPNTSTFGNKPRIMPKSTKRVATAVEPAEMAKTIEQEEGATPKKQKKTAQIIKQEEGITDSQMKIKKEDVPSVIENLRAVLDDSQGNPQRDAPSLEEELQRLHSLVTDPYDPHVPNDLLAYRERKEIEQSRLKLEREARETMERQQQLRQQLEEERQRIHQSGASANEIIEHRTKTALMGGGRGRGISNLPAWLIKKQKEELGKNMPATTPDNSATRTVILSNLTSPGDIDDDLAGEVQEECEEACGSVQRVQVKDANPPLQPEVQVWVQFQLVGDAHKAANLFHGRMFGKRRITAKRASD